MAFDRGYLSHHMVTDVERMLVVLDEPFILMTDLKLQTQEEVAAVQAVIAGNKRPLLVIAEEVAPACVITLLGSREKGGPAVAAIHPPDYGHWRKSMLEDLAIVTGGRVIARELGGRIEQVMLRDLGTARQVRITADQTVISGGGGDPMAIAARREQVARLMELAPPNIDRDKLAQRLSRLAGGTAMILAGGATPVEQKRRAELIEDAIHAARAAAEEGIVPGGGTALLQVAAEAVIGLEGLSDGVRRGALLLQTALAQPLAAIALNCGLDPEAVIARVRARQSGHRAGCAGWQLRGYVGGGHCRSGEGQHQRGSQCVLRGGADPDDADADCQEAGLCGSHGGAGFGRRGGEAGPGVMQH